MARYGRNADGSVSVCRAKPGNEGRYGCTHSEHVNMTPAEADAVNERAISESAGGDFVR